MKKQNLAEMQLDEIKALDNKEFEAEIKRSAKEFSLRKKSNETKQKHVDKMMQAAGFDLKEMDSFLKKESVDLDDYLKKTRPTLVSRKENKNGQLKDKSLMEEISKSANYISVSPEGNSIISAKQKTSAGSNGQSRAEVVLPTDSSFIKIEQSATGSGTGWGAVGYSPEVANVYFRFRPNRTARWNLSAYLAFDGFYILKADDWLLVHKSAEVKLKVIIKAFQYAWQGEKSYTFLDERETNDDYFKLIETTESIDTSCLLRSGDSVLVKVTIELHARAQGSGSYAEINFLDGTANRIIPVMLLANPV